ncbi:uncharacterized protein LOC106139606 [Amyelois transitella]|uniref:uncharacterized protein LOC106139606 n=1 Tax=Amyelois transitella TaxID=680683 RepID=UPI00067DED8A|nr:uncharacterized protein LOC106139606 [Amyelois transitella]
MEREADRRLIALVKKFPALYDVEDAQYQDTVWKMIVWRKIAGEMDMDAKLCRSRWFNMRDIYRKSIIRNHMKRRLGQNVRVYKYARDMDFLKKYFSNLAPAQEPDPLFEDGDQEEDGDDNSFPFSESSKADAVDSSEVQVRAAKLERPSSPEPFVQLDLTPRAQERFTHPVDAFLACIEPTLKALPPYYLSLAKGEIFATVQKYELRMYGPNGAQEAALHGMNNSQLLDKK